MSSDKDSTGVGVLIHSLFQTSRQVLFKSCIFNDGDFESIMVPQHVLSLACRNTLDLLNVADLKATVLSLLPLHEQSHKDSPLGMRMNTAASTAVKRSQEKRCASGWFQFSWLADVFSCGWRVLWGGVGEDEDFIGFDHFLLDAGRRNEDMVIFPDGCLDFQSTD